MMKCLRPSLIVAASLAYKTPFVTPMDKRTEAEMARKEFHRSSKEEGGQPLRSDHMAIVNAYNLFLTKTTSKTMKRNAIQHWCRTKYLSYQTLHSMKSTMLPEDDGDWTEEERRENREIREVFELFDEDGNGMGTSFFFSGVSF